MTAIMSSVHDPISQSAENESLGPIARVHADRADCRYCHTADPDRLAIPLVRVTIQRERERELRYDLWQMRDAIDRYKDAADTAAPSRSRWAAKVIRRISRLW